MSLSKNQQSPIVTPQSSVVRTSQTPVGTSHVLVKVDKYIQVQLIVCEYGHMFPFYHCGMTCIHLSYQLGSDAMYRLK